MGEPLRVALVGHTAEMGGAEWALLRLVTSYDRDAVDPVVVLGADGPLASRLRREGVQVEICPLPDRLRSRRKDSLRGRGLLDPLALASLGGAIDRLRARFLALGVRVVHTNSLKAHVVGGIAGRLAGARVIWHVRDHISPPYLPSAAARAVRLAAAHVPHRVVAVSESAARTIGHERVTVLHQGIPLPPRCEPRRAEPLRVGLVGRIAPWKGQDVFLDAADLLGPQFADVRFAIAGTALFGEDALERELRARAERPSLRGRVEFLGFRDDVWPVYRDLDVVVHASTLPEPYGNVILEGMAATRAVVASAAGGALELVDHDRTGVLVPPGRPDELAAALASLLRDPERRARLAQAGRAEVEQRFSLEHDARRVEQMYREVAA